MVNFKQRLRCDAPNHFFHRQLHLWRGLGSRFEAPSFDSVDLQSLGQAVEGASQRDGLS